MNLFEIVKYGVGCREAAERYGVEVNHYGMALCPFHNDRHPSLYVADDHYHCFACGEHGDVIDFAAKLFGLPLYEAAQKLAADFHLTPDKPPSAAALHAKRIQTEAQQLRENERLCFSVLSDYAHVLRDWKMDMTPQTWPEWYDGRHINEVLFCQQFLEKHPMKCVRGRLFTVDGLIEDEGQIGNLILEEISGVLTANLSKTVANLLASIKLQAYSPPLPIETDRIHVANGTYFMNGSFTADKSYCNNRLTVAYNPDAPTPKKWLQFLSELLQPEDIPTLQEFLGYEYHQHPEGGEQPVQPCRLGKQAPDGG